MSDSQKGKLREERDIMNGGKAPGKEEQEALPDAEKKIEVSNDAEN